MHYYLIKKSHEGYITNIIWSNNPKRSRLRCHEICDLLGCDGSQQCLCCFNECCIAFNGAPKGCGPLLASDDSGRFRDIWVGLGFFCCNCILKPPTLCCGSSCDHCCCITVSSFPFNERFVPFPICACCFCQKKIRISAAASRHTWTPRRHNQSQWKLRLPRRAVMRTPAK